MKTMKVLSVRLTDQQFQNLNKLMERTLGNQISNNTVSDNFRLFLEKLPNYIIKSRKCYRRNNDEVSISAICSKCDINPKSALEECPENGAIR